MSPPEVRLWSVLRTRPGGWQFRRQHPCAPYVLDFYRRAAALAIEVDGSGHAYAAAAARDERRDAWLLEQGIMTLRIDAKDVHKNLEAVLLHILDHCARRAPPTYPPRHLAGRGTSEAGGGVLPSNPRTPPPPSAVPLPAKSRGG